MLQRLFNFTRADGLGNEGEHNVPEIDDDQPRNYFNEIEILNGHSDLVDSVIKIDNYRVLTTGHDKKGVVWNCKTGEVLCQLIGHTRTISAAVVLENYLDEEKSFCDVVVTAAADQTIRVWDLVSGHCRKVVQEHQSTVKSFQMILLEPIHVLTAGQDVCLWSHCFQLLSKFQRNSLDYIHTFISVKIDRFVTATDQPFLMVYDMNQENDSQDEDYSVMEFQRKNTYNIVELQKLPRHRESVTALVLVSDAMFASASMDGGIVIWTTHRLVPTRKFNHYETFMNPLDHTYPYSVRHLMVAEQKYVFAAIGTGFAIFDAIREKCICRVVHAHHSQITCMTLLHNGSYLATSSLDGTIRLWGAPLPKNSDDVTKVKDVTTPVSRLIGRRIQNVKTFPVKLELLGLCCGHSNSVQSIVDCGEEGFISCASDGLVILWKDSRVTQRRRDDNFRSLLKRVSWLEH